MWVFLFQKYGTFSSILLLYKRPIFLRVLETISIMLENNTILADRFFPVENDSH